MVKYKHTHCPCNNWSYNEDLLDVDSIATAVVTPQTSDHDFKSNTTSNEVTRHVTRVASLAVDEEEMNLYRASTPRRTGGELEGKPNSRPMLATSSLMSHLISASREKGEEEEEIDLYGASPPRRTNVRLESEGDSRQASATSENKGVKKEEGEYFYGVSPPHRAGSRVKSEPSSDEASTASSTSSIRVAPQFTPSTSSADGMEDDLIDLYRDCPPRHAGATISTCTCTTTPTIPKHEIFLHNLPSKQASVTEVRAWITSWFVGRDILPEVPWKGGADIGIQPYIDCICWSGDDVHRDGSRSLESDLRGWLLGAYARHIVRDVERARELERDREWDRRWEIFVIVKDSAYPDRKLASEIMHRQ
ncbi:hypothetical protein SBOR_1509 [Sclerotinia borealis F-4128]|uniref:Uncharacterized protein n=1 Tax=Sclerotinia borealis (strain F-4128) TaxID=1432307 RepID=W9CUC9_SCLBF|nr:hypothetical protein SBOR_1509 [Sclerotinia borealis F-4128]